MAKKYELKEKGRDPSYRRVDSNLPAKKYKHTNPTQLRLSFELTGGATKFIDIGMALSVINRKFYRQGVYYYVNSVEVYNDADEVVDLLVIPDTWVTRNAYVRAKQSWDDMNELALLANPTIAPKYHDFKIYMSDLHRSTGSVSPSTHGVNASSLTNDPDEWAYSQMVSADDDGDSNQQADNFYLHMLGPHNGTPDDWVSVGIVKSYGDTRLAANAAGTPTIDVADLLADPIANLLDYSSEEQVNDIITRLDEDNDLTPYDGNGYMGSSSVRQMQHVSRLVTTATNGRAVTGPGFCVPFGLIAVDSQVSSDDNFRVVLNIAPGTYNGVYAERV